MALLGSTPVSHIESSPLMPPPPAVATSEFPPIPQTVPSAPPVAMGRVASSKMPRGRLLGTGDRAVLDVDSRFMGESKPPQLEVTPITKLIELSGSARRELYDLKDGSILFCELRDFLLHRKLPFVLEVGWIGRAILSEEINIKY